jgi:hypothetical protein
VFEGLYRDVVVRTVDGWRIKHKSMTSFGGAASPWLAGNRRRMQERRASLLKRRYPGFNGLCRKLRLQHAGHGLRRNARSARKAGEKLNGRARRLPIHCALRWHTNREPLVDAVRRNLAGARLVFAFKSIKLLAAPFCAAVFSVK